MKSKKGNKNSIVLKSNDLNELSPKGMSLQQLRFIIIYLGMINPSDENTRLVRFSLGDFQAIMEMGRLNIKQLTNSVDDLLSKVTGTITETGGILRFQYFKRCLIDVDSSGEWYIEIDAHDDALPMFFNLKKNYFKYQLWNGLRLKSTNQLRFYEILKQYQWRGFRVLSIEELKKLLGVNENDYPKFYDFKRCVIDVCQKALSEYTDISFTYEPHGKKGRGGKVLALKFNIFINKGYQDPITLEKFIDVSSMDINKNTYNTYNQVNILENNENIEGLTDVERFSNFEIFWQAYPEHKKAGKKQAMEEWDKLPKNKIIFDEIMDGLEAAKKSSKWTTDSGQFVPEPSNWLKKERWKDNYKDTINTQKADNKKKQKSNFQNYKGREWDYEELARKEQEFLDRKLSEENK